MTELEALIQNLKDYRVSGLELDTWEMINNAIIHLETWQRVLASGLVEITKGGK